MFLKRSKQSRTIIGIWIGGVLLLVLLAIGGGAIVTLHPFGVGAQSALKPLAGQKNWQQGTSSLLFGTNDASWQWSQKHLGNTPEIAATVKAAGITVIRSPLHSDDAEARVAAIESTGAQCLGILQPEDAAQVVKMLGNRCRLYEFMNEPDNGGPSATEYAASWNKIIPGLRSINPQASFIGPVVAFPDLDYIRTFLTQAKQAGNLPDAVSFHMYPCTDKSIDDCPSHFADYTKEAAKVKATVNDVLGQNLPLCITEYNFSWKPGQTPNNDPFMRQFTTQSLQAMAQAGIVMANQFDIASNAGGGALDMVDPQTGEARPQLDAMKALIQQYSQGASTQATPTTASTTSTRITPTVVATAIPTIAPETGMVQTAMPLGVQQINCTSKQQDDGQANCMLLVQVKEPQMVMLTWWNQNGSQVKSLNVQTSTNSTDGQDGKWTTIPVKLASSTGGGAQMFTLSKPGWVKVVVQPSTQEKNPVNGLVELYSVALSNNN
jgi:hypothetical protein